MLFQSNNPLGSAGCAQLAAAFDFGSPMRRLVLNKIKAGDNGTNFMVEGVGQRCKHRIDRRLLLVHVQAGGEDRPVGQRSGQRLLVHDRATADIHEHGRRLHAGDGFGVDEMAGLGSQGRGHHDGVGFGEPFLERGSDGMDRRRLERWLG